MLPYHRENSPNLRHFLSVFFLQKLGMKHSPVCNTIWLDIFAIFLLSLYFLQCKIGDICLFFCVILHFLSLIGDFYFMLFAITHLAKKEENCPEILPKSCSGDIVFPYLTCKALAHSNPLLWGYAKINYPALQLE